LGSIEFIKKNIVNKKQYIITATPKEEIDQITKKRGIMNFFDNIFGSPQTKDFWVKKLIKENQIHPSNSLFIGDAYADYEAAKNNDVYFILRKTKDNKKLQEDLKVDMIDDFIELPQVLNKNYFA
jgi:phosphoglycolate phosphatase-like HAD superfamily hydrolase